MKLGKIIGLAFTMIIVASAFAASTAAAEPLPKILPEPTAAKPVSFTGINLGEPELVSAGGTVKCAKATGSGTGLTPQLGTFLILFEGCKETTAGTACTGLPDTTSGNIDTIGTWHIFRGRLKIGTVVTLHKATIVFLPFHVHFSCAGGLALTLVLGCAAGLLNPVNTLAKTLEAKLLENEAKTKVNDIEEIESSEGVFTACSLKANANEGAEGAAVEKAVADFKAFKQGGKEVEVLIMS
jgi:hypothetical protein